MPDFPLPLEWPIAENDLKGTSLTLQGSMASAICIPAGSIPSPMKKHAGHGGQGISILTEFAVAICKDSGENAIASKIDLGGKVIILSFSIPIITALLETLLNLL